jgi:hypothetical protein
MPEREATGGARPRTNQGARRTSPGAATRAAGTATGRQPDTRQEVDPDVALLLGLRPADAAPLPDEDELDDSGAMTDTRIYEGELEARAIDSDQPDETPDQRLESLVAAEARSGETDDAYEASDEGLAWIPPTDPPVRAGDDGNPEIAAGFATSADDEPFDADHHGELLYPADERAARVEEALRADAATSGMADQLSIEVDGGRVVIHGRVEDLEDEDDVVAVAEEVPGVTEVISKIVVASLEGSEAAAGAGTETTQGGQR